VGDIIVSTTKDRKTTLAYLLAGTWKPTHVGVVVAKPDGELAVLEAVGGDEKCVKWDSLALRPGRPTDAMLWVRQPMTPLSALQSERLTQFAQRVVGKPYAMARVGLFTTPLRARGPVRTYFIGRPKDDRNKYFCVDVILDGFAAAGVLPPNKLRPGATFPRDLFTDRSTNPFLRKYPPLADGWTPPARWLPGD
jgi:hypothetical protein